MTSATPFRRNLLYVGADKAGSSWWHSVLSSHRQVVATTVKDPFFFDRHYQRGLESYRALFDVPPHVGGPEVDSMVGLDVSHDYLYSGLALERIARDVAEPHLLVSVREPWSRTLSALAYLGRHRRVPESIAAAIAKFPETVERSLYAAPIERAVRVFGRDRVRVVDFERIATEPVRVADEVFTFAGLAADDVAAAAIGRVRTASAPRWRPVGAALKTGANAARAVGAYRALEWAKSSPQLNAMAFRSSQTIGPAVIEPALDALFSADPERLDDLLVTSFL